MSFNIAILFVHISHSTYTLIDKYDLEKKRQLNRVLRFAFVFCESFIMLSIIDYTIKYHPYDDKENPTLYKDSK